MKTIKIILFTLITNFVFTQDYVTEYYNEITKKSEYGSEHGGIKWRNDVKIYLEGDTASDEVKNEIDLILKDLNVLIETINISIVNNKADANSFLYIGDFDTFKSKYNISVNGGIVGYATLFHYKNIVVKSGIFISNKISGIELKSVLREEITQSLGFTNDSWLYPDSIFYEGTNRQCEFSKIDKEIIKLHYNK
jgi:hypothetical protein